MEKHLQQTIVLLPPKLIRILKSMTGELHIPKISSNTQRKWQMVQNLSDILSHTQICITRQTNSCKINISDDVSTITGWKEERMDN